VRTSLPLYLLAIKGVVFTLQAKAEPAQEFGEVPVDDG